MRKVITILLTVVLSLTLIGCGGVNKDIEANIVVKWNNGTVNFGGKDIIGLTEYDGSSATYTDMTGTWRMFLEPCQDLTFMSLNSQGIEALNMDDSNGMKVYTEYLDTQLTCCYEVSKDNWYIAQVTSHGLQKDVAIPLMKKTMDNISFTYGNVKCNVNDILILGDGISNVKIDSDCVRVPGLMKVTVGSNAACTNPYTFIEGKKEYAMMKGTVDGYDLYQYEGLLIQTLAGYPIEEYIEIK